MCSKFVKGAYCNGRHSFYIWNGSQDHWSDGRFNQNQIAYLRGKRYEVEKKLVDGNGNNQYGGEQCGNIYHIPKSNQRTGEDLASEYGVLTNTRLNK